MRKGIVPVVSAVSAFALPILASAQGAVTASAQQGIIGLIMFANTALNDLMILMITAAVAALFYGVVRYIFDNAGGGEARAKAMQTIIWSIVALFVMVSIWGIIRVLQNTFGVNNSSSAETPSQIQIGG